MLISPALSAVKQIAAEGKYHVLPVSCEMLLDLHGKNAPKYIGEYVKSMKDAMK